MSDDIINLEEERRRKADAQHVAEAAKRDARIITQDGVATIFAKHYAERLRYCHSTGSWFEFDGFLWRRDEKNRAFEFVRQIARELTEGKEHKEMKEFRKTAFAAGVEKFSQGDPALAVTADYWDRDPYLLGTPGGTVDLRSGILRPGDPADGITKATAATPSDHTDCPVWLGFLREATGGDVAMVRFLQQWAGYCLTGDTREHAILFVHGPGGNGKSVFLNTLTGIMGEYATTAPSDIFTISIGDRHPTELAMLRGARLVAASETEQGKAWAEIRIKALTGGDEVSARFMRCDYFKFRPAFKLTIIGNHQPTLENVDAAVRRRFNVLPFTFCPDKPDHQLEEKLRDEWPEIFRWVIKGCLDWQQNGLARPERMLAATEEYFSNQDLLGQWLATCCDVRPGNDLMLETTTELYRSWSSFAKQAGAKPDTEKNFVGKLENRRFENRTLKRFRTKRARGFEGISLKVWGEA
jgi:putative DNA primase/helicase